MMLFIIESNTYKTTIKGIAPKCKINNNINEDINMHNRIAFN